MYKKSTSPVVEVTFGQALKISLDHYYDLLKKSMGGLNADEYIQLKASADILAVSDNKKASEGGYKWFGTYNAVQRADREIEPSPIGGIEVGMGQFYDQYGRFLRKLRTYVTVRTLTPEEQVQIAVLDGRIGSLKEKARDYAKLDRQNWKTEAEIMGYDVGDATAYVQWSGVYGHLREIQDLIEQKATTEFQKRSILAKQYDPLDEEIIAAEYDYTNPAMNLRYPVHPDYDYPNGDSFNLTYLATLPPGSTALFDDRAAVGFNIPLSNILTMVAGAFSGTLDRNTAESKTIETDWRMSVSAGRGPFKVKGSISDYRKVQEEFTKGQSVSLHAKSSLRLNINFLDWFSPALFEHQYVRDNIRDFAEFFGPNGSLLYYPTALVLVRGFGIEFSSSQDWSYDYKRNFSASMGGGFSAFGINFGGSGSYGKNVKEHKVDVSNTKLKVEDDESTVRFVGYVVKKNRVFEQESSPLLRDLKKSLNKGHRRSETEK